MYCVYSVLKYILFFQIRESVTRDFTFTGYLCKMPPDHSVSNYQLAISTFLVTHYVSPFSEVAEKILCAGSVHS